jgi:hypothetical protein
MPVTDTSACWAEHVGGQWILRSIKFCLDFNALSRPNYNEACLIYACVCWFSLVTTDSLYTDEDYLAWSGVWEDNLVRCTWKGSRVNRLGLFQGTIPWLAFRCLGKQWTPSVRTLNFPVEIRRGLLTNARENLKSTVWTNCTGMTAVWASGLESVPSLIAFQFPSW